MFQIDGELRRFARIEPGGLDFAGNERRSDFDWGKLGETWWLDVGKQLGAEPRQLKFAVAKHRGCSNTEAARQAGYKSADPDAMRSTGLRCERRRIAGVR